MPGRQIVFVGAVSSILENGQIELLFSPVEILAGAISDKTVSVYTGQGGGDCGYPFVKGVAYLVYAYESQGRLQTIICTPTAPAAIVSATIAELRNLRDHRPLADVFGNILSAPIGNGWEDLITARPLADVPVDAVASDGRQLSTNTDQQGGYRFGPLARGGYSIEEHLPTGFHKTASAVYVDGPAGPGCRVDVFAKPDGRISGRVADAAGAGVAGFITLQRVNAAQNGGLPRQETKDGRFSLELLPPGDYRLVFHPQADNRINFSQSFYLPGADAALKLALGQHIDDLKFEIH